MSDQPPAVPVIVISAEGVQSGVLTSDEHGDLIKIDEEDDE